MFNKPLDEMNFEYIQRLKKNAIPESNVLEYKQDIIDDGKLIKEVCGFANAQGGYLVFGVMQSDDKPPIPKSLPGISLLGPTVRPTGKAGIWNLILLVQKNFRKMKKVPYICPSFLYNI